MSVTKLPSGRWRAQVYDPVTKANVSVSTVIGGPGTYRTKREAKAAREQARVRLGAASRDVTVAQFRERWISDPLFLRPRASTNLTTLRGRWVRSAVWRAAVRGVDDAVVAEWLAGGRRTSTVSALRAMWNDAMSAAGGRLVESQPVGRARLRETAAAHRGAWTNGRGGRLDEQARLLTPPSFAAYLGSDA